MKQFPSKSANVERCSPAELEADREGVLLLDVRTPVEFAAARIEGALLRPLGEIDVEEIASLAQTQRSVVLLCQSGGRAARAAQELKGRVPVTLKVLEGGVAAWEAAGLPLKRQRGVMALERQVRIAAGALVVLGVALGVAVHPGFYTLCSAVGAGLIFAGVTDTCGLGLLLARAPWNRGSDQERCRLS